ncbi:glutathione S-transferase [Methylobacterium sp. NEAU 140]|uniref:glutathione S-transferase n=1 Tax=Methylobacterium sp. NEAU 140 TaxID=3064945 RepID=UPI0027349205|nr:glutathione S-transferase [Methylobacterium sp. NEAU 140]MDP4021599.1 glutathione S-transferase [Methylobacterium sp. NEAU 140]
MTQGHHTHGPDVQDALKIEDAVNEVCPWSGKPIAADSLTLYNGAVVGFCNPGCRDKFARAIQSFEAGLQARRVSRAGLEQ